MGGLELSFEKNEQAMRFGGIANWIGPAFCRQPVQHPTVSLSTNNSPGLSPCK